MFGAASKASKAKWHSNSAASGGFKLASKRPSACKFARPALRHSQLAPCSFQYTSSTPPGFTEISVRLKLKPNEPDKSQTAVFQFVIVVPVGVERAPRTLPSRRVPRSSPIRPVVSIARPSFRPWPATARPGALGSRRYSEGLGLSVVGGANRGETLESGPRSRAGAAPRGSRLDGPQPPARTGTGPVRDGGWCCRPGGERAACDWPRQLRNPKAAPNNLERGG